MYIYIYTIAFEILKILWIENKKIMISRLFFHFFFSKESISCN